MATANLKSKISLDSSEFVTAANGVLAQTRKMALAAGGLVTAFAGLKAVQGTLKGITSATGAAANLEDLNVELRTFLGGADEARDLIKDLTSFSVKTPFETDALLQTAKILSGSGITDGVGQLVKEIGAVAKDGQQLQELGDAVAKGFAKGKFQTEELNKFLERGINLMPTLEEVTGASGDALQKMIENGLSFEQVSEAIARMSQEGGQFFGLLEARSQTTNGLISTLSSAWENFQQQLGAPLAENLKPQLNFLIESVNKLAELAPRIGNALAGGFSKAFDISKTLIENTVNIAKGIREAFSQGVVGDILLNSIKLAGGELINRFAGAVNFLRDALVAQFVFTANLMRTLYLEGGIIPIVKGFGSGMVNALQGVGNIIRGSIGGALNGIVAEFQALFTFAIEKALEKIPGFTDATALDVLREQFKAANEGSELIDKGKAQLGAAFEGMLDGAAAVKDVIQKAASDTPDVQFNAADIVDTDSIRNTLTENIEKALDFEQFSFGGGGGGAGGPAEVVANSMKTAATSIKEAGEVVKSELLIAGTGIKQTLGDKIRAALDDVKGGTLNKDDSLISRFNRMSDVDKRKAGGLGNFLRANGFDASKSKIAASFRGVNPKLKGAEGRDVKEQTKNGQTANELLQEINNRLDGLNLLTA